MEIFGQMLSLGHVVFLLLALGLALSFEFVNGFHDTANAVATVIYTNTLKPWIAVVWSGLWNLTGVLTSTGMVAFAVVSLLPVELVIHVGSAPGFAMVFSLLIAAIIWNVGTWYLGLPASSSHTLVGAIMGVGIANAMMSPGHAWGEGVNWAQAKNIGIALVVSPIVGFIFTALLLLVLKLLVKRKDLFESPEKGKTPPFWIRALLVFTCTGVSFAHGSNDGQKGMGLIMLILIGVVPAAFAVNLNTSEAAILQLSSTAQAISFQMDKHSPGIAMAGGPVSDGYLSDYLKPSGKAAPETFAAIGTECREISTALEGHKSLAELGADQRRDLRNELFLTSESLGKAAKQNLLTDPAEKKSVVDLKKQMDSLTRFIPIWVKFAVALSLGLGTMIGWKRVVVTVGEKIGKSHLTYAQGASAELVTFATIEAADMFGLPVSTTHVLSSGIAGAMAANGSGLQMQTLRNILLAWVLTLPVCMLLGGGLFAFTLNVVFHAMGIR
ncbi:MAG TPA: inorganic phosphate transporter [bacterium]|nr:inorganic phosphate transporter [bacterium]